MNATVTMKEEVRTHSLVREVPLDKIQESKTNPRSHFDEGALAELAANIKEHGVLQPVLLRPRPNGVSETYELVVGSRRYRASKLARRETIPATIRELTDTQVVEIQLVENLLREGVPTRYEPTPQEKVQRKKAALAERIEKHSRVRILDAIRKKLRGVLSRPDLEMIALDYFRRLGHDNHRRLSKVYAWEEKKSKASWVGKP
jgi:ParB family chromosome partitioning protein